MASLPRTRVQPPIHTGTVVDEHTIHAHGACGMVYANLDPEDRTLDVIVFHDDHPVGLHLTSTRAAASLPRKSSAKPRLAVSLPVDEGDRTMKTTLLRDSDTVFSEITVAERDARAVAIERIDKHAYECRIGGHSFLFRSARPDPRAAPRGPGIEFRHTLRGHGAPPVRLEELPGNPGLIASVRFEEPLGLHIERMNEGWYWCRFGRHEFSMKTLGGRSAGVELVRA